MSKNGRTTPTDCMLCHVSSMLRLLLLVGMSHGSRIRYEKPRYSCLHGSWHRNLRGDSGIEMHWIEPRRCGMKAWRSQTCAKGFARLATVLRVSASS